MRTDIQKEITITQEELDHINKFILEAVQIDLFAKTIQYKVEEVVMNDPTEFADEDGAVSINEELVDKQLELEWKDRYPEINVPTILYEAVWEKLNWNKLDEIVVEAEMIVRDLRKEQQAEENNPLANRGMKQSDFLA